jgi:hypothetical protein
MSPTVLKKAGFQVKIYLNDDPPAHVHVRRAGKEARSGWNLWKSCTARGLTPVNRVE